MEELGFLHNHSHFFIL